MLLKRGKEFPGDGDLVNARLLLRRAAEGGSAEAALVFGTTFDPLVIAAWRARGASGYRRGSPLVSTRSRARLEHRVAVIGAGLLQHPDGSPTAVCRGRTGTVGS